MQEETEFSVGQNVEVAGECTNSNSWYSAKVMSTINAGQGKNEKKKLLIEYENLIKYEKGLMIPLRKIVDVTRARPQPPVNPSQTLYYLSQNVDVYFAKGWWKGKITEVLDLGYRVLLDYPTLPNRNMHVKVADLRIHQDWANGCWQKQQQQMNTDTKYNEGDEKKINQHQMSQDESTTSTAIANESIRRKCAMYRSSTVGNEGKATPLQVENEKYQNMSVSFSSSSETMSNQPSTNLLSEINKGGEHDIFSNLSECLSEQPPLQDSGLGTVRDVLDCDLSVRARKFVEFSMLPQIHSEVREQYHSSNTQDFQSFGHSTKSFCHDEMKRRIEGAGEQTISFLDSTGSELNEKNSDPSEGFSPDKQLLSQSSMIVTLTEPSHNVREVQAPCTQDHCYEIVEEAKYKDGLCDHGNDETTLETGNLVFIKSYAEWADVDSMEELHLLPQQPHFRSLGEVKEDLREGIAMGHMINFVSLVKRTSALQLAEPKSSLEVKLQALNILEPFGFDVAPLRTRLEKLLRLKERQLQIYGMLEEYQRQITKEKDEEESLKARSSILEERVLEIQESIAKMREK